MHGSSDNRHEGWYEPMIGPADTPTRAAAPLVGLLSDAHGNPDGLRACLAVLEQKGCGPLYFLGDAVGYLPFAADVLNLLGQHRVLCQMGNHEAMLCGQLPLAPEADAVYGLARLRATLAPALLAEIAGWPIRRTVEVAGRRMLLLHGGPRDALTQYVYPDSDLSEFDALDADVVAVGHSHHPFVRRQGGKLVIGTGSCGLPRDVGNSASCAVYDPVHDCAQIVRAEFDADDLIARARRVAAVHSSVERCLSRRSESDGKERTT